MTEAGDSRLPAIRIGDAERQDTLSKLTIAHQGGYLDFAEFDERTAAVVAARTQADLDVVTHDLPANLGGSPTGPPPPRSAAFSTPSSAPVKKDDGINVRGALAAWLVIAIITNIIWFATSFNDDGEPSYWPIWPMIGVGIPLIIALANKIAGNNKR